MKRLLKLHDDGQYEMFFFDNGERIADTDDLVKRLLQTGEKAEYKSFNIEDYEYYAHYALERNDYQNCEQDIIDNLGAYFYNLRRGEMPDLENYQKAFNYLWNLI